MADGGVPGSALRASLVEAGMLRPEGEDGPRRDDRAPAEAPTRMKEPVVELDLRAIETAARTILDGNTAPGRYADPRLLRAIERVKERRRAAGHR